MSESARKCRLGFRALAVKRNGNAGKSEMWGVVVTVAHEDGFYPPKFANFFKAAFDKRILTVNVRLTAWRLAHRRAEWRCSRTKPPAASG